MSYQQNYSASVPYSGSVSVSYPSSESGGTTTAHFSGEVPVYVTINVNTSPFDSSVYSCNNSVDSLTGSIVAMNAAQCAVIAQAAQDISQSLINGFFGTVKTEISQQMQALDSTVKAMQGLLLEQGKAASSQKQTMETDFNRISSRYTALFKDLDEECYKRIYALDKQAFALAEKVKQPLLGGQAHNIALNMLEIDEESRTKSFLLVSHLKAMTRQVLQTLYDYITQESRLTAVESSFLDEEKLPEQKHFYTPVIFAEKSVLEKSGVIDECFTQEYHDDVSRKAIEETTRAFCDQAEWESMGADESGRVKKEFDSLAESYFAEHTDEASKRVYAAMLDLRGQQDILSVKK